MKKKTVIEILNSFGDEFDAEKLIEKLLFVEDIEQGLRDVKNGKIRSYENVKERFADR